jgi:hypothetical protein
LLWQKEYGASSRKIHFILFFIKSCKYRDFPVFFHHPLLVKCDLLRNNLACGTKSYSLFGSHILFLGDCMRWLLSISMMFMATSALAEGIRAKDIVGISTGMSIEEVQASIKSYNPKMVTQRVHTNATNEIPAFVGLIQGTVAGAAGSDSPQDEIMVRFTRSSDGQVRASAVSHLVRPLPEDERITFKAFTQKLIAKYGAISNMNDINSSEIRWVFDGKGQQKLRSLRSDIADYERCGGVIPYLGNTVTRASLPEYTIANCGDFLYVRMFPLDQEHRDVLAGYYITYVHQDQFLKDIQGITTANKDAQTQKIIKKDTPTLPNSPGPKL